MELRITPPHRWWMVTVKSQQSGHPVHVLLAPAASKLLAERDVLKVESEVLSVVFDLLQCSHFPGRTTWCSSSRKTGTRAAEMSSSTCKRSVRNSARVYRSTDVFRIRCASSMIKTSKPLGSAVMNWLKYLNNARTLGAR